MPRTSAATTRPSFTGLALVPTTVLDRAELTSQPMTHAIRQ